MNVETIEPDVATPRTILRVLGFLPVAYGAYVVFDLLNIAHQFETMFKEMDLGKIPWRTEMVFLFVNSGCGWIALGLLPVLSLVYWKKFSQRNESILIFIALGFVACHSAQWFFMRALFEPLFTMNTK